MTKLEFVERALDSPSRNLSDMVPVTGIHIHHRHDGVSVLLILEDGPIIVPATIDGQGYHLNMRSALGVCRDLKYNAGICLTPESVSDYAEAVIRECQAQIEMWETFVLLDPRAGTTTVNEEVES